MDTWINFLEKRKLNPGFQELVRILGVGKSSLRKPLTFLNCRIEGCMFPSEVPNTPSEGCQVWPTHPEAMKPHSWKIRGLLERAPGLTVVIVCAVMHHKDPPCRTEHSCSWSWDCWKLMLWEIYCSRTSLRGTVLPCPKPDLVHGEAPILTSNT